MMSATKYQKELLKIMKSADWPDFERGHFLDELEEIANEMHSKDSTEGYLGSLLIYQQLIEEMLKLLVRYSNLLIQCSVFPQEIHCKEIGKRMMFGQILGLLQNGLMDEETEKLITICQRFSELRNRLAHKITLKTDVKDIRRQARQAKKYHQQIYSLFDSILDQYRLALREYNKNYSEYEDLVK